MPTLHALNRLVAGQMQLRKGSPTGMHVQACMRHTLKTQQRARHNEVLWLNGTPCLKPQHV